MSGFDCVELVWVIFGMIFLFCFVYYVDYCDCLGVVFDDVVVMFFLGLKLYIGEDMLEIFFYGNLFIV